MRQFGSDLRKDLGTGIIKRSPGTGTCPHILRSRMRVRTITFTTLVVLVFLGRPPVVFPTAIPASFSGSTRGARLNNRTTTSGGSLKLVSTLSHTGGRRKNDFSVRTKVNLRNEGSNILDHAKDWTKKIYLHEDLMFEVDDNRTQQHTT